MADPYAMALGLKTAPSSVPSAILSPQDQASSDAMERGPTGKDGFDLAYINATPAQRLEMERSLRLAAAPKPQQAANDPYASALGIGGPATAPVAAPIAPKKVDRFTENDAQAAMGGAIIHGATAIGGSIIGGLHGLGRLLTGGSLNDAVNAVQSDQEALTYNPDKGSDAAIVSSAAAVPGEVLAKGTGYLGDKTLQATGSPALASAIDVGAQLAAPGALLKGGKIALRNIGKPAEAPVPRVEPTLEGQPAQTLGNTPQGSPAPMPQQAQPVVQGAAPAPVANLAQATPELQQAVAQAQAKGKPIDPVILQRHVDAQTLPVPVELTEGQATLNPELISREMNGRGKERPAVSPEFYNQQGKALAANVDVIANKVAPDLAKTDPTTLGQMLVDAYKAKDAPIQADIAAKYKALEEANGGQFPIDGQALVANVNSALSKALKSGSVPSDLQAALNEFANGRQMTFEDFETLRSDAADAMRTSSDGRARAAASIIRQQLEDMPLTPEAAGLKPLADAARQAARERFAALDADPAYKAAVNDTVPMGEPSPLADRFTNGYIVNGRYANVRQMKANLANDPVANQAIAASALEHLRSLGKVDPATGAFTQAGWNKGVTSLGPKLDVVLGDSADTVRKIGETAKLTQAQPKGSYVNNSNTLVGTLAEAGKSSLEGMANVTAGGIPVGTWVRKASQMNAASKAAKKATAPGAGMTNLSDIGKPKP